MFNDMLVIWDWGSNTIINTYVGYMSRSWTILKYLSSGLLAGPASPKSINLWYSNASNVSMILNNSCLALEELSNGNLASAGMDGYISFWNSTTGTLVSRINVGVAQYFLKQVCTYLLSASGDKRIYLWNLTTLGKIGNLSGHTGKVKLLDFTQNGLLLSASEDNSVRLWDVTSQSCLSNLSNPLGVGKNITCMRLVSSNVTAVAGRANYIALIRINATNFLSRWLNLSLPVSTTFAYDLRVSSSNTLVVSVSDGSVAFFNLTTNVFIRTLSPLATPSPTIYLDLMSRPFCFEISEFF
jgi:WD40 repeat protein